MASSRFVEDVDIQRAEVLYLKREPRYEHEKPYKLRYDPGEEIPRTNCINESHIITIHDLRGMEESVTLKSSGFMWLPLNSSLSLEEFYEPEKVQKQYYAEVRSLLSGYLKCSHVEILEHQTRKRHEQFPISTGKPYKHLQPTTIVHQDFTLESALRISLEHFKIPSDRYSRMQCINVWKPLRGPIVDWPLALCDRNTIDHPSDAVAVDVVTRAGFLENAQFYHNPQHKWYYLSDQTENEATLFCQIDTAKGESGGVAHSGFRHSNAEKSLFARESVELRAFVYYD